MTSLPVSASVARTTPDTVLLPAARPRTRPAWLTEATLSLLMEKTMWDCGWGPPSEVICVGSSSAVSPVLPSARLQPRDEGTGPQGACVRLDVALALPASRPR